MAQVRPIIALCSLTAPSCVDPSPRLISHCIYVFTETAGVGILTPISLHSIPVVGQLAASLSSSLRQVDAALGGIGWRLGGALNSRARPLGLTAGAGCGVAVGYGWGAGVMLKPNAAAALVEAVKVRIPPQLLEKLNSQSSAGVPGAVAAAGAGAAPAAAAVAPAPLPPPTNVGSSSSAKAIDELKDEVRELTKIVLRQQVALEEVQQRLDRELSARKR